MVAVPPDDLDRQLDEVRASRAGFLDALVALGPAEGVLGVPSLLPGWTRGHVLAHLARNADAFVGALAGARRGEPTAMYPRGVAGRNADIEAGARRPASEIVADVVATAAALDEAWSAMTPAAWD